MKRFILFAAFLIITAGFSVVQLEAQKLRLRSQITPDCNNTSSLKFADIYADGNIAVQGSFVCRGVFIYDITNPDAPVLANWYNPGENIQFLEAIVIGNRGYFGSGGGTAGVHIVDLTNPYAPVLLGTVTTANGGFNAIHEMVVFRQNGADFLIENFNGFSNKILKVINVTNPASPIFVRDIIPTETLWVHAIHIRGNRMFTSGWGRATDRARTEIYNISSIDLVPPTLLGFIEDQSSNVTAGNNMHSSWSSEDGNYLYSCRETQTGTGDVRVYNISNPAQPLLVNSIKMSDLGLNAVTPHNPAVAGNYLYVSWYQAGVQVFDISTPSAPRRVGQYDTFQAEFAPTEQEKQAVSEARSWDMMCGSDFRQNSLPTTYNGNWAVFPFLGPEKVLAGDLASGLLILDAREVALPLKNRVSDFDGDRKTDFSLFTPSTGQWKIESSSNGASSTFNWGAAGDELVTGDYDGDGKSDIAVWRPSNGFWYLYRSSAGFLIIHFGENGDVPVAADYDADGKTDLAVWRPSNGHWYVNNSTLGYRVRQWGVEGDKAFSGDYEGDGKADLVIWRPSNGTWYIIPSSSSIPIYAGWGQEGDKPLVADFDGDGKSEYVVFRPSTGTWYVFYPATGAFTAQPFGIIEDLPMPADYDGDGKADYAVFRPSTSTWYRLNSTNGGFVIREFGQNGDNPSPLSVQPQ
ncbi:MAG: FG-GAP-like repeat-containing protein [Acidobacteriota bacterium]|nr:FG-GAP-like repeat-containing protein [Acidobacteriota bacterium]